IVLIAATGGLARAARQASHVPDVNLTALPLMIGSWTGREAGAPDEGSARLPSSGAYLHRTYPGTKAGAPVGLYIAYYAEQRPGVSIHSPLHCLPGTGWEPLDVATLPVQDAEGDSRAIRRMVVSKNLDRALVLYWYAVHGRMLAGEVAS